MKPLQIVRTTPAGAADCGARRRTDRPGGGPAASRGGRRASSGAPREHAIRLRRRGQDRRRCPLPDAFAPYQWAATIDEVAARHGLSPAEVLKFDQNTPPLPGVPQVPLGESFATLNGTRRAATASFARRRPAYVSRGSGAEIGWEQVVVGAGADDLILLCARTYLGAGTNGRDPPADVLPLPHRDVTERRRARPTRRTGRA